MPEINYKSWENYIYQKHSTLVINPAAIAANVKAIRNITSGELIAVVKENGYGLGLKNEYDILKNLDIHYYGVTNTREALALRSFGCNEPILLMSPEYQRDSCVALVKEDITLALGSEEQMALLEWVYSETGILPRVHIKIETGMGRYGFRYDCLPDFKALGAHLRVEGCFTHLAGKPGSYKAQVELQRRRFLQAVSSIEKMGIPTGLKHICNSAATMTFGDLGMDGVRVGSALLGKAASGKEKLKTAVWLEVPISEIRQFNPGDTIGYQSTLTLKKGARLALARAGHGDGVYLGYADTPEPFFRGCLHLLSVLLRPKRYEKAVWVNGKKAVLAGRLGVAHMMIDVTHIPCKVGDTVKIAVNPLLVHPAVEKKVLEGIL